METTEKVEMSNHPQCPKCKNFNVHPTTLENEFWCGCCGNRFFVSEESLLEEEKAIAEETI